MSTVAKHFPGSWWSVLMIACMLGVSIVAGVFDGVQGLFTSGEAELQVLGRVPDFTLLERSGQSLTREHLLGKVWIANFIFTRCTTECPLLSNRMAQLQELFAAEDALRLVSISVDPEYDTPEVLAPYADSFHAQPQRWLFVTGEPTAVHRLVREGFLLGLQDSRQPVQSRNNGLEKFLHVGPRVAFAHHGPHASPDTAPSITHSGRFVLVDRQGQIRSYCNSNDESAWRRLPRDVRTVLRSPAL
jgi:protein SCO1/2